MNPLFGHEPYQICQTSLNEPDQKGPLVGTNQLKEKKFTKRAKNLKNTRLIHNSPQKVHCLSTNKEKISTI